MADLTHKQEPRGVEPGASTQRRHAAPLSDQRAGAAASGPLVDNRPVVQRNNTGLPDQLKAGIESMSGMAMDHVKVHYNSSQPAQLNAHAYAQGGEIHLAPGQEQHLPHEAWHVVQQAQGRVRPTLQMKAVAVNDDPALEKEADRMGWKAAQFKGGDMQGPLWAAGRAARLVNQRVARFLPGRVAQLVGGQKFGMEVTGARDNQDVQVGLDLLKKKQLAYKQRISLAKKAAIDTFQSGSKEQRADLDYQQHYTEALKAAEMTAAGLLLTLDDGLTHAGDVIFYNGIEIAHIRSGDAAYIEHQAADAAAGTAAIFKRHTLDGPSEKEYVDVGGAKLRRYAYRGITPQERLAFKNNKPLLPLNHSTDAGRTGYKFEPTGVATERVANGGEKIDDLHWLNQKARTELKTVPAHPALRAFLQTRKGVGKLLSATSTPNTITSNHGAEFTGFGKIKMDLARVPAANILHHYKQPQFSANALSTATGKVGNASHTLNWETERANETVLRNRELVISEIPAAAVTNLTDTTAREAYEVEFRRLYDPCFEAGFNDAITQSGLAPLPAPERQHYPWQEDHFTIMQANRDFNVLTARNDGAIAAAPYIAVGVAYKMAYATAWSEEYEDAAYLTDYVQSVEPDEQPYIVYPAAPDPGQIPSEIVMTEDANAGAKAGAAAGAAAGTLAGAAFKGPGTPTVEDNEDEDEEEAVLKPKNQQEKKGGNQSKGSKKNKGNRKNK